MHAPPPVGQCLSLTKALADNADDGAGILKKGRGQYEEAGVEDGMAARDARR